MSKSENVVQARRCNRLVVEWKRTGFLDRALYCKQMRNLWMGEARRA